jgi:hypothetical protein
LLLTESDAEGWIHVELPPACPETVVVRWGSAGEGFSYERPIVVDCLAGNDQRNLRAMLHNIGYDRALDLEVAVKRFQGHYGVDSHPEPLGLVAGDVPPATRQRLVAIYEGSCDASMAPSLH